MSSSRDPFHDVPGGVGGESRTGRVDRLLAKPVPLSASQESCIRDIYHANVRRKCHHEISDFAACAQHRTLSVSWKCRNLLHTMNACLAANSGQDAMDQAREQWFTARLNQPHNKSSTYSQSTHSPSRS